MISRLYYQIELVPEFRQGVTNVPHRILKHCRESRGEAEDASARLQTPGPIRGITFTPALFMEVCKLTKGLVATGRHPLSYLLDPLTKLWGPARAQMNFRNRDIFIVLEKTFVGFQRIRAHEEVQTLVAQHSGAIGHMKPCRQTPNVRVNNKQGRAFSPFVRLRRTIGPVDKLVQRDADDDRRRPARRQGKLQPSHRRVIEQAGQPRTESPRCSGGNVVLTIERLKQIDPAS